MTTINICSMLYSFQHRYWWMLSSLVNQINAPELKVSISTHRNDPHRELTQKLKSTFGSRINIIEREFNDDKYGYRGYVRGFDIEHNDCDWILFSDADMVFPQNFFNKLQGTIEASEKENDTRVISIPRMTMAAESGNAIVAASNYDSIIEDPYNLIQKYATKWSGGGRISGAGYFQLVKSSILKEKGITKYAERMRNEQSLFSEKMNKFSTDIVFRRKLGGVRKVSDLPTAIHINHFRKRYDSQFNPNECR